MWARTLPGGGAFWRYAATPQHLGIGILMDIGVAIALRAEASGDFASSAYGAGERNRAARGE